MNLLDDPSGKVYLQHVGALSYPVTAGSVAAGIATLTVGTHSMTAGQAVTIVGISSTGGTYNATEAILTGVGASTISYAVAGAPTYVSGGAVQVGSSPFDEGFGEAYDALFQSFLTGQVPGVKNIVVYTLPPNTTSLTPATAGIADFADFVKLRERLSGSSELFRQLDPREELTQRPAIDRLLEFVWRNNTFYFIGATSSRDLEITYESSGTAPTADGTSIGIDSSLTFLSNYTVGVMGGRKGYDEIAQRCMNLAVGPKYDQGSMGGELFRLVQAKVRSEQKTPVAPRRFSAFRPLGIRRAGPFVAAQTPSGVGTAPAQFTTADGTITGTIDGVNAQFVLAYPVSTANVYRNGVLMTKGVDYTFGANLITFLAGQIPQAGPPADIITAEGWV